MSVVDEAIRRAITRHEAGDVAAAAEACRRILRIDPQHGEALRILSVIAHQNGRVDEAVAFLNRAVDAAPDSVETRLLLANRLADADRTDEAVAQFRIILHSDPRCTAAWFNLGCTFQEVEDYEQAAACYSRALQLEPGFRDAGLNFGIVFRSVGELEAARSLFEQLITADRNDAEAQLQRALTLLAAGNFADGWDAYEWRWRAEAESREFHCPTWDGSPLAEKTLLISAEQGIGDEIMFASCLPDVMQRVNRCLLECEPRLVPLFRRSFPDVDLVPTPVSPGGFDVQIPIGSLPRLFRRDLSAFPQRTAYLVPDAKAVETWKRRFAASGNNLTVGVSWRGGRKPDVRRCRSTDLLQWRPVLETPGIGFVNLQYGPVGEELQSLRETSGIIIRHWEESDPLVNLDDFAAQIAAVDLVISVDNATVHLAGALGVPVWTLLPAGSNFRWLRETENSPWYPSLRLFRQETPGDWNSVLQRIAAALRKRRAR